MLVEPDTYIENINFNGKNIVVASLFLTTADTSYISSTIIDGNSSGAVLTFKNHEDSTATITGFTLRNGYAESGGGIHCLSSRPTITHCTITNNHADSWGGGIYARLANPKIADCKIKQNTGIGIYCYEMCFPITNCLIEENTGNGIELAWCLGLQEERKGIRSKAACGIISNCTVTGNSGSGIVYRDVSCGAITDCVITGNGDNGILCQYTLNTVPISNCVIEGNAGDGIWISYFRAPIDGCVIADNGASGIYSQASGQPLITDCTVTGNQARGLHSNNEFYHPVLTNCILWADSLEEIYAPYPGSESVMVTYSDIQGGWEGEGNIDCDPWFCYPDTGGDYYLAENSCCIGAGEGGADIGARGAGCAARGFVLGMVTDAGFNPIEDVTVSAPNSLLEDTSDIHGGYSLSGLREDTFDISFSHPDYRDTTVAQVLVTSGDTTMLDVAMEYISCSLWVEADTVSTGQDVYLYMNVQNRGDAPADSLVPHFTTLGGGAVVLDSGPIPLFADVAVGTDTTFRWVFTAEDTHWVHWVGYASGTGHNTGCMITAVEDTTDSVFIQTAARLEILAVTTGADTVRWGDDNIPVDVIVQNTGEADARVDSVNLRFVKDTTNLDSQYVTALLDTLDLLPGFSSDILHFMVAVGWSATEGWVEIHSRIFGSDKNSLELLSDSVAILPDSFYVAKGFLCGDCNGDGRITAADATYIVGYIYREGPPPIGEGDVNVDQRITAADATYLISYIYGAGPEPCNPPESILFR